MNDTTQKSLDDAVQPEGEQKTEIAEYSATAAGLARLQFRMKNVVHDVKTKEGMAAAKKDVAELRGLRTGLDELRLQLNADDQARIKKRNAEAARITGLIEELEDPLKEQIKAENDRIEEMKLKKQREEEERAAALRQRIAQISAIAVRAVGKDSDNIREKIATVEALDVTSFDEMQPVAANAKADTLVTLNELLRSTLQAEESARRLAESNRLLAAQREENERLEREARERREAEEAAERQRKHDAEMAEIEARNAREALAQLRTSITDLVFEAASATASEIAACVVRLDEIELPPGHDLEGLRLSTRQKLLMMRQAAETAERFAEEQRLRDAATERQRKADAEAAEKRAAEAERGIRNIRDQVRVAVEGSQIREGGTLHCMEETLAETEGWVIDERFGDRQEEAIALKSETVNRIRIMIDQEKERIAAAEAFARQRAAEEENARRAEMARQEIDGIRQQVMIAGVGRAGVRKGGTIECIRETLEETKAWRIGDHFGPFKGAAQDAKDQAVQAISAMLTRAEEEAAQREADRRVEQERAERLRLAEVRAAAMDDVTQLLKDILSDGTLAKSKRAPTHALAQRIADLLKIVDPLPGGQYFAADGTLMTAEGTRSVFDDVDQ